MSGYAKGGIIPGGGGSGMDTMPIFQYYGGGGVYVSAAAVRAASRRTLERMNALNPECQQGKHDNCDGSTWDDHLDAATACPCDCHEDGAA